MGLSLSEKLMYSVLHITTVKNGIQTGAGTGFIFCFFNNTDHPVLCLVSNRHVLSNCSEIELSFTRPKDFVTPDIGNIFQVRISTSCVIHHPDPNIDLSILPLAPAFNELERIGKDPFFTYLAVENIPTSSEWARFTAIEEVVMPSHPLGFRDMTKSQPIFRRGITATHPALDFQGNPTFLIDMPCFEGCSGSPVIICNEGIYFDKRRNRMEPGNKLYLLGIQFAIFKGSHKSQIKMPYADAQSQILDMPLYIGLGNVIRSTELLAFERIFSAQPTA